ncbi:MAG: WD40-like beta Propeller containing protein [Myxococcales bacterium]|nr:WD40-like beta Propeller containing protein [Myxococcales bacterium]
MTAVLGGVGCSASTPTGEMSVAAPRVVFTSQRDGNAEIYSVDPDGGHLRRVTNSPSHDDFPLWAPDGRHISMLSDRDGNWELYIMNADGADVQRLTYTDADEHSPAWAPDGGHIAFSTDRDAGDWEVYVMAADGQSQVNLTRTPGLDYSPNWSPDGRSIAFVSERDGNAEIYVMDADGSNQRRLTDNADYDWLGSSAWSDDGRILFMSRVGTERYIRTMNPDGSDVQTIVRDDQVNVAGWAPDAKSVVLSSINNGRADIFIMSRDGKVRQNVSHDPVLADSPDCGMSYFR